MPDPLSPAADAEEPGAAPEPAPEPSAASIRLADRHDALVAAIQAVVQPLELPVVLERIVRAAVELVDARYGALGVIAPEGGLESFLHVGASDAEVAAIGHVPEGRGLLGALIDDPRPIRLRHLRDDPRSVGFPAGHPPMDAFLGVPVRVRDAVYGNLYLAEPRAGEFSVADEALVTTLAATAGFAIANARLFDETRLRQQWIASSAQIVSALLDAPATAVLPLLADELAARTTADRIGILVPGGAPDALGVVEARGTAADAILGLSLTAAPSGPPPAIAFAAVAAGRTCAVPARRVGDGADPLALVAGDRAGAMLAIPLRRRGTVLAVIVIARAPDRPPFSVAERDIADDLANRVGLALELAEAREQRQLARLRDDRARIARDLHDHVIQQLFGVGLELQAIAGAAPDGIADRLSGAVATIDEAIVQIRTAIFAVRPREAEPSLRHRMLDLVAEFAAGGRTIPVAFAGPVDLVVRGELADESAAVARELLANAVRHSGAQRIRLGVTVEATRMLVTAEDDGVGIPASGRRSGLGNLRERAERRAGTFVIDSAPGRTVVEWAVPLPEPERAGGADVGASEAAP